jgi:coenzyme F420-reducing hydrogenase delta subunit
MRESQILKLKRWGGKNKVNENSTVTELKSQIKQNEEQIEKLRTTLLEVSSQETQAIVNKIEELVDKNEKLNKQLEKELSKTSSSSD